MRERLVKETGEATVRLMGASFDFGAYPAEANAQIAMMPGRFMVEMSPLPTMTSDKSGLLMAARDENLYRPDCGVVIAWATHESIDRETGALKTWEDPLYPGQAVVVDHEPGHRVAAAVFGAYEAASEVRIYGSVVMNKGFAKPWPIEKSILMLQDNSGLLVVGRRRLRPYRHWVLLARDGVIEKSAGGVYLPDSAKFGGLKATVIDAGSRAFSPDGGGLLERGQRVLYTANLVKKFREIYAEGEDADRLCLVHADSIHGVLAEAVPDDYLNRMVAASERIVV